MEEADKELLTHFTEVLVDLRVEQHVEKTPFSVKLSFQEDRLVWKGGRPVGPSTADRELLICDITLVQIGCGAKGFGFAQDEQCLTLFTKPSAVSANSGRDFEEFNIECSSKVGWFEPMIETTLSRHSQI